jgi:hypothetical protein
MKPSETINSTLKVSCKDSIFIQIGNKNNEGTMTSWSYYDNKEKICFAHCSIKIAITEHYSILFVLKKSTGTIYEYLATYKEPQIM